MIVRVRNRAIGDGYWERDGKWRKGQLRLYFRTTPTHIPEGRILDIEFEQKYENPAEGQFDVNKLRDDLIARFGPPRHVMLPGIEWYEGDQPKWLPAWTSKS